MSEYTAKFAATTVIWLAVTCISVFASFRSGMVPFLMLLCALVVVSLGAVTTMAVWHRPKATTEAYKESGIGDLA